MKLREFTERHLWPTLDRIYGDSWQSRVSRRVYGEKEVIVISGVERGSPEHHALRNITHDGKIYKALLGDNTYSFVVDR